MRWSVGLIQPLEARHVDPALDDLPRKIQRIRLAESKSGQHIADVGNGVGRRLGGDVIGLRQLPRGSRRLLPDLGEGVFELVIALFELRELRHGAGDETENGAGGEISGCGACNPFECIRTGVLDTSQLPAVL